MSKDNDPPSWFSPQRLNELLEAPLEKPYEPLPAAPNYMRFYDYFCLCLDELAGNDFMADLARPTYSCSVIYTPDQTPVNFMFTAAIMDGADQQLDCIKLVPNTWHRKSHERLQAMFEDLGELADVLDLSIQVKEVGPVFLLESDTPEDLVTLLQRYKNLCGFRTLDDETHPFLTRGRDLEHCVNRYQQRALRHYGIKNDGITHKRIDISYLPPVQYVSPDFAYVAHQKTWDRDTLGFSMTLMENILREEKGMRIQPGHGLLRLQ